MSALTLAEIDAVDGVSSAEPVPAVRIKPALVLSPEVAMANLRAAQAAHAVLAKRATAAADFPTIDEATEQILWRYACTPGVVSQWIDGQCQAKNEPIKAEALPGACELLTAAQTLVLLMTGPLWALPGAALRLRELFEADTRPIAADLAPTEIDVQRKEAGL